MQVLERRNIHRLKITIITENLKCTSSITSSHLIYLMYHITDSHQKLKKEDIWINIIINPV